MKKRTKKPKRMKQMKPYRAWEIFGRACGTCGGEGAWISLTRGHEACPDCNGTGRVGAAENRWTCLGGGSRHHTTDETCARCGAERFTETWTDWCLPCPGRDGIVADDALWAEVKRAWRTRTRTTVLEGYQFQDDEEGGSFLGPRGHALTSPPHVLCDLVPTGVECRKGKWTIRVDFEPEDEK